MNDERLGRHNDELNLRMIRTPRNIDSRNSDKRSTCFYSRSKKRCMM
jgi:hypothetical protein